MVAETPFSDSSPECPSPHTQLDGQDTARRCETRREKWLPNAISPPKCVKRANGPSRGGKSGRIVGTMSRRAPSDARQSGGERQGYATGKLPAQAAPPTRTHLPPDRAIILQTNHQRNHQSDDVRFHFAPPIVSTRLGTD